MLTEKTQKKVNEIESAIFDLSLTLSYLMKKYIELYGTPDSITEFEYGYKEMNALLSRSVKLSNAVDELLDIFQTIKTGGNIE